MGNLCDKLEQLKSLKTNKGVQYLLNEGCKILGNPILTHDMEYKVIAYTDDVVTDDPIWDEFVATGTVNAERLEFYKKEDFLGVAANAEKVTLLASDELKYLRIYGKLFNCRNIQIGCAVIVETYTPFKNDDMLLYELFCDILNREIARIDYFCDYGQKYQEFLINKLIDDSNIDRALYTAHMESFYINLKSNLYVAVIDTSKCKCKCTDLENFRDLFILIEPKFKYSIYMNYIVAIISSENSEINIQKDLSKFNRLFEECNIYAGISSCFDNLFELQSYYTEALSVLEHGLNSGIKKQIFLNKKNS